MIEKNTPLVIDSLLNLWKMLSVKEQLMGFLRLISKGEVVCCEKPISFGKC